MDVAEYAFDLAQKGEYAEASKLVNEELNVSPQHIGLLMSFAHIMMGVQNFGMAYHLLKYVEANAPKYPEILNNLAMATSALASSTGREEMLDEAEGYLRKAADKKPSPEIYNNLALVSLHKNDPKMAVKFCEAGLKLDENHKETLATLGHSLLMLGMWEKGFHFFDYELGIKTRKVPYEGKAPYLDGHTGGRLYVRGEQGIGDEITYASVLNDAAKVNTITYECDERLSGLFKRSFPDIEIIPTRFKDVNWMHEREFDSHCLSGSLCREYRKKDEDFPRTAFLKADPERCVQWRALLDTLPGKKIGIAWTGGLQNTFQARRSLTLEKLLPILSLPGVTWVSLQYQDPSKELAEFKEKYGIDIKHWPRAAEARNYDETAALVNELDCVVSVTTAVVHLCGALGKQAYVLVPKRCRWFYHSETEKHRWYDSLTLFRQDAKWPVAELADRLTDDLKLPRFLMAAE
jgi:tetratricopeptide (TPR) repeat protein